MSHGQNIFTRTNEEKQAQVEDHYRQDRNYWERETTRCLLSEIKNRLQGCIDPFCLSCANTNALVDVIQERFDIEMWKAKGGD